RASTYDVSSFFSSRRRQTRSKRDWSPDVCSSDLTADPRLVPSASRIPEISSEEMLELAASGSKILHLRAVEYARRFGVKLHVRRSEERRVGKEDSVGGAEARNVKSGRTRTERGSD